MSHPVIAIQADAANAHPGGCGQCSHATDTGPACPALVRTVGLPPRLSGPEAEVQRLLAALAPVLGFAPGAPEAAGVRALRITPDEVELTLATDPACGGGAVMTDAAFQTLRALLPDTDIYIAHAA
jgi:hypothetical protein